MSYRRIGDRCTEEVVEMIDKGQWFMRDRKVFEALKETKFLSPQSGNLVRSEVKSRITSSLDWRICCALISSKGFGLV